VDRMVKALDGGSVLLVHHTGKDKTTVRGASALEFAMDTVHITSRDVGSPVVSLKQIKNKYGTDGHEVRMAIKPVGDGAVLVSLEQAALDDSQAEEKATHASGMFKLLAETSGTEGLSKAEWAKMAMDELEIGRSTAYRTITLLLGTAKVEQTGAKGRERYVLRGSIL